VGPPEENPNPYKGRYGDDWEVELKKVVDKSYCNVCDMIDHIIAEGNRLFADTRHKDDWVIWHDALGQWWTPAAQAHLASKGFANRQVRSMGETNKKSKKYKLKLVGDSPELMPLDNNLFAELMDAVRYNMACTRWLPNNDPRKFRRGTPKEAWRTLERSWEHGVPSSSIVRDISRLLKSIKAIIKAKGCVVHFDGRRTGRRSEYHHQDGKRSKRPSRAKENMKKLASWPLHPDAKAALAERTAALAGNLGVADEIEAGYGQALVGVF
jgi:hypothetical protein